MKLLRHATLRKGGLKNLKGPKVYERAENE